MSDWDKPDNMTNTIGNLTLYSQEYGEKLSGYIQNFDWDRMPKEISRLQKYFENMMNSYADNDEIIEEYDLIGINSTSFREKNHHNLFMEWDTKSYVPNMNDLEEIGGMIIETDGGIHVIKEENLLLGDMLDVLHKWDCCPGFTSYTKKRHYSCLRVCPKGDNKLKIIKNQEGFLYSVYRDLIESLENVWA